MDIDNIKELNVVDKKCDLKEERGDRNIWDKYIGKSTFHGLHFIFERRAVLQRFIWFIIICLMCGLLMWQTLALVLEYFDYKVTTTVELVTERETNFPAVTLCNFNKYRRSVVNNHTDFYKVLIKNPLLAKDGKSINWTKYASVGNLDMKEFIRTAGHKMKYDNLTKKGMLYRCTWKEEKCNYTDFTTTLSDMGLCYTFNSGKNKKIRKVHGIGKHFGLHLKMSVEQDEYIGKLALSAGLRIRVHDPDEPPLVSSLGFLVMPGSHVFASISRQRIISLKYPYKTMCEDKKLPGITIAACYDNCKENYVAKKCNCEAYFMRDTLYKPCTVRQYFNCVIPLEEVFSSTSIKDCPCSQPCDTTKYNVYLSYGAFPSREAGKAYKMENSTKDLLAIDIFFEDLNYNLIKQVEAYSLQNLLGEIGGLIGLFLGAGIITVFELLDVAIMAILTRLGIYRH